MTQTRTYSILAKHPIYSKMFDLGAIENISMMLINSVRGKKNGETNNFNEEAKSIMTLILKEKQPDAEPIHFDTFLFDFDFHKTKFYNKEFLLFDLIMFFIAQTHGDRILNQRSNRLKLNSSYAYDKISNLLYILEHHHITILKQGQYFNFIHESILLELIDRCLQLRLQYAAKTDLFQKLFRLLLDFVKKHDCKHNYHCNKKYKGAFYHDCIFECILANHLYCDEIHIINTYFQEYCDWIEYQMQLRKDYNSMFTIQCELLETAMEQLADLCDTAAIYYDNVEDSDENKMNRKMNFLNQTNRWIHQVLSIATWRCNSRNFYGAHTLPSEKIFEAMLLGKIVKLKQSLLIRGTNLNLLVDDDNDKDNEKDNDSDIDNDNEIYMISDTDSDIYNDRDNDNGNETNSNVKINSSHIGDIWKICCQHLQANKVIAIRFEYYLPQFVWFCNDSKNFTIASDCVNDNDNDKFELALESNIDMFNYLFDLLSKGYINGNCGVETIIQLIKQNKHESSRNHAYFRQQKPILPPKLIKLWLSGWMKRLHAPEKQVRIGIDNLMPINHFDAYSSFVSEDCSINYFICNIWEDLVQDQEREYFSRFKVFVKYNIPNEIIDIILKYKNNIVLVDNIIDEADCNHSDKDTIWIDTYGLEFGHYPKILNWSLQQQKYHLDFVGSINQAVKTCWIEYFKNKKKILLVEPKCQAMSQSSAFKLKNTIVDLISAQSTNA